MWSSCCGRRCFTAPLKSSGKAAALPAGHGWGRWKLAQPRNVCTSRSVHGRRCALSSCMRGARPCMCFGVTTASSAKQQTSPACRPFLLPAGGALSRRRESSRPRWVLPKPTTAVLARRAVPAAAARTCRADVSHPFPLSHAPHPAPGVPSKSFCSLCCRHISIRRPSSGRAGSGSGARAPVFVAS